MKYAFFGTANLSVSVLTALEAIGQKPAVVVSAPDHPRGRGRKVRPGPVSALAADRGWPLLQPESLDIAFHEEFAGFDVDVALVIAYGKILSEKTLSIPCDGFVNLHTSLLPRWRGAAPIHRALLAGDPVTGVTLQTVVREVDAGAILDAVEVGIGPDETAGSLTEKLAVAAAGLGVKFIESYVVTGLGTGTEQDVTLVTAAPKILKGETRLDWSMESVQIDRLVRALNPSPGAWTVRDLYEERLTIESGAPSDVPAGVTPGTVVDVGRTSFVVACGTGGYTVSRLRPAGRKSMDAGAYLRGRDLTSGESLS